MSLFSFGLSFKFNASPFSSQRLRATKGDNIRADVDFLTRFVDRLVEHFESEHGPRRSFRQAIFREEGLLPPCVEMLTNYF